MALGVCRNGETEIDHKRLFGAAVDEEIGKLLENLRSVQRAIIEGFEETTRCSIDQLKVAVDENRQDERLEGMIRERNALTDELGRLKEAAEQASRDQQTLSRQLAALEVEQFVLDDLTKSV